jgi:hypothetical protein
MNNMKQEVYVIATRGKGNKEIYLAVDESRESKTNPYKIYFKWVDDINEAMADFTYTDIEETAINYFKNYTKWYIKSYMASFN